MNREEFVFSQLASFLDNNKFRRLVDKCHGDRYVKNFTCRSQLLVLMSGQLCGRESLRDLIVTLDAHRSKCCHLGFGHDAVAKSTLADASQGRGYRIF